MAPSKLDYTMVGRAVTSTTTSTASSMSSATAATTTANSGAFYMLPIELNKMIGLKLDDMTDIMNYRRLCRATRNAINGDRFSFWRPAFRKKYDLSLDRVRIQADAFRKRRGLGKNVHVENLVIERMFRVREARLAKGVKYAFHLGNDDDEKNVIEILQELIVDSFKDNIGEDEYGRPMCKNQRRLKDFVDQGKFLMADARVLMNSTSPTDVPNADLLAVKLMCAAFLFDMPGHTHQIFATEELQRIVYLPTNAAPLFNAPSRTWVNLKWLFDCFQFFRNHMVAKGADAMVDVIKTLSVLQKPSPWSEPLQTGVQVLGVHWLGMSSFLERDEYRWIRRLGVDERATNLYVDQSVEDGNMLSFKLNFRKAVEWPAEFEARLPSANTFDPTSNIPNNGTSRMPFSAWGNETRIKHSDFELTGWLNALPPQGGIPGWQRITFMQEYAADSGISDALYAFEGVVLPGGRMMLGRWWDATTVPNFHRDLSGPFIAWAVDEPY